MSEHEADGYYDDESYNDLSNDDGGECWHDDYEVSWEGRAHCYRCNEVWYLTSDEFTAHLRAEAEWHKAYYEEMRREHSWRRKLARWASDLISRLRPGRLAEPAVADDEIPF